MGSIVYWTLIRLALIIPLLWYLSDVLDSRFFWIIAVMAFYLVIINPAILAYRKFKSEKLALLEDTICSNCKHFNASAALCMKYDEHPTPGNIPCGGIHWEPL